MKTKSPLDICHDRFEYQDVLSDLILTQFNKEIKYDYTIPPTCDVLEIVSNTLEQWQTKSKIKEDIYEIVRESDYYGDAILRKRLWNDETSFGNEHFYGFGDLFRYRKEKKAEGISSVYSHPNLANIKVEKGSCKNSIHRSLKKEVEEFLVILNRNIEKYYKKLENKKD